MLLLFYFIVAVFAIFVTSSPVHSTTQTSSEDYRLPEGVIGSPIHYNLEVTLGSDLFDTNEFSGNLELTFSVTKATKEIKIHAGKYLNISKTSLRSSKTDIPLTNSEFKADSANEILTISASQDLENGATYVLTFEYTAALMTSEDMYGFYRGSYKTKDGNIVPFATTQFRPTYARYAFPCFDEPSFKATFDIKIKHLRKYTVLGNTRENREDDLKDDKLTTTTFDTTPKMSTYLIAFVLSDFTCDETSAANILHRICSRDDFKAFRKFAADIEPKLLNALEQYTGVDYIQGGISKIDLVAIPDFAAGTVQGWGLAIFRESELLYDEVESMDENEQQVILTITHKLAHMWFGNMVTADWWSETFLNEGFARFFQYFAAHEVVRYTFFWYLDQQFVTEQVQAALQVDSLKTSKPLSSPTVTPYEVSSRFDVVSYSKGASILRMVQHMIGDENFKEGLNVYLNTHQFGNVKPKDLWTSFPDGELLDTIMNSWVQKAGYPLLKVTTKDNSVVISQHPFYTDGSPPNETESWIVPVTFTKSSDFKTMEDTSTKVLLYPGKNVTVNLDSRDEWIILNNQQVGYYRVLYDAPLLKNISMLLESPHYFYIDDLNRAQLVDDTYNLAKANIKTYSEVLDFCKFLKNDDSYFTWDAAFRTFEDMLKRTGNKLIREALSAYILDLMETVRFLYFEGSNPEQSYSDTIYKVLTTTWDCKLGYSSCINNAVAFFKNYKYSKKKPTRNLRFIIYCNAMRNSADVTDDWNFLWEEFLATELATERNMLLSALGCAREESVLTGYLEKSINASLGMKQQDTLSVFASIYGNNPEGVDIATNFFIENYGSLSAYFRNPKWSSILVNNLADRFTHQEQVHKLEQFLKNTEDLDKYFINSAKTAIENAKDNIEMTKAFEAEMKIYFSIEDETTTTTTTTAAPTVKPSPTPSTTASPTASSTASPTTPTTHYTMDTNTASTSKAKISKSYLFNVAVYMLIYLSAFYRN